MTKLSNDVWKLIESDPITKAALSRGIVNRKSLAEYLIHNYRLPKKEAAIQSAIRRYAPGHNENHLQKAYKTIAGSKFSTRTGLAIAAFQKDPDIQKMIPKIYSAVDFAKGEVLLIIQGEESIKIVLDEKNLAPLLKLLPRQPSHVIGKLAELSIKVAPDASKVPGVLSLLDSTLFQNNVNIVETFSCVPELIWIVDENDIMRAYTALFEAAQQARKLL